MRIGVVSDTHDHAANVTRIVELLNAARVDQVVHTGDITRPSTLERLGRLRAPVVGVFGNNDVEREALRAAAAAIGARMAEHVLTCEWAGRRIGIVHDPATLDGPEHADAGWDLLLHGHTHRHVWEHVGTTRVFNPGECAGHLPGHNRVGVVDLARLTHELLWF